MGFHLAFFIVNKNGSLVYNKVFSPTMRNNLKTNDLLRLSSTFHSMHSISSQVVPTAAKTPPNELLAEPLFQGISEIVTSQFTLKCFQTNTAIKFILVSAGPDKIAEQDQVLQQVYEVYSDYVNKNPFQEADQPIRSELFEEKVSKIFN